MFIEKALLPASITRWANDAGHDDVEPELPNGSHMNGVTLNGAPQSDSDPESDSDEFGPEGGGLGPWGGGGGGGPGGADLEHMHKQASGAPQPLEPELVTLSLLPRSQWQSLVHLDAIKVRLPLSQRLVQTYRAGVVFSGRMGRALDHGSFMHDLPGTGRLFVG